MRVCSVHQLVYEKERGLRLMQKQHGLGDAAYWSVHAAWFAALYLVFAAAFALLGGITGLHMFTLNSPGGLLRVIYWPRPWHGGSSGFSPTVRLRRPHPSPKAHVYTAHHCHLDSGDSHELMLPPATHPFL